jgi:putative Mg2+ transporter-C (MgtC) family protein
LRGNGLFIPTGENGPFHPRRERQLREVLLSYWSTAELATNFVILLHLMGAVAVGIIIGYERSYHGRAAGLRTYALVCVGSTLLTVVGGYPHMWFGGTVNTVAAADPTRVIQGVMTGIGFLGAGVIMKEGFSIRGLSTAASIWVTAAIGVVIGLGFYGAAVAAAVLTIFLMSGVRSFEGALPHETVVSLSLTFPHDHALSTEKVRTVMASLGYEVADWSFELTREGRRYGYQLSLRSHKPHDPTRLAEALGGLEGLVEFRLAPNRS